jgi:hypothetical protein
MDGDDWEGFDDLPDENQAEDSILAAEDPPQDDAAFDTDSDDLSEPEDSIPSFPAGLIAGAKTKDELSAALAAHGKLHGYSTVLRGGSKNKQGVMNYYGIFCSQYGDPQPSRSVGLRKTTTKKTGCQFKASAYLKPEGWVIHDAKKPEHRVHNHPPALDPSAFVQHRKMEPAVKEMIEKLSAYTAIRAREILAIVKQEYPDSHFTVKDVNNVRQALRRREMDGCMATGATIKAFDEMEVQYVAKWDEDNPERLLGIIFTFKTGQEMWKRFPDCLSLDNTYRTNLLGFPLFVVTVQTNVNSIANVAFGLIGDETQGSFDFLADSLNQLRVKIEARSPAVTITDKDGRLRQALLEVFPDAQQQLCRFHMNQNVTLQAKKKGKWAKAGDDDDEGLRHV